VTVGDLIKEGTAALEAAGVESPQTEATLLLGHCLDKSRSQLFLAQKEPVESENIELFHQLLSRRLAREPFSYISGEREFWSLDFLVTPDVLIPRPETEFLLETVLTVVHKGLVPAGPVLDLCCGSGVIAVVLAKECGRRITALDLSFAGLQVAQKNAARHLQGQAIDFIQGDLLTPIAAQPRFALVVSNPPYIKSEEIDHHLEPEVAHYEPRLALDGGKTGLSVIEKISSQLPFILVPGAHFFMEIGADQGQAVTALFNDICQEGRHQFVSVAVLKDYAGRDRILHAVNRG
jgi:release factor glutamine methyltransferase